MCIGLGDIMKKFVSILIALSLAISSLFAFSINAYANSLKTAVQIMLGQSINATVSNVDDNAKTIGLSSIAFLQIIMTF